MLSLRVLGCSDAFNSGGRRHTSFLLEQPNYKILLDCGANTVQAFRQLQLNFNEVDCVIITHFHGDHYGGLPYLLLDAAKRSKRKNPLLLISPPGLQERILQLKRLLYPGSEDILEAFPIAYKSYRNGERLELPFGCLTAFEVRHAAQTLPHGIRLEADEKIIAFSGDTGWHENITLIAQNSDLFICECNFYNTQTSNHLNYIILQEKQEMLNCKRIVLTHLGDEMFENIHQVDLEVLQDGQQIDLQ